MTVPGRMTLHTLDGVKGYGANMYALDFHAKLSANVTFTVPPGRCMHLNSVGQLETGATGFQMPLFTFPASNDPDVQNPGGDATADVGVFVPVVPKGEIHCLVATGAFELASTEYDTNGTYNPNTPLKSTSNNTTLASGGLLSVGTFGVDSLIGCVSRGVGTNGYGTSAVYFWPLFLPHGL